MRSAAYRFAGAQAIFIVNASGRGLHRITPWQLPAGDGPNWLPDGRRILFASNESDTFTNSNLFTVGCDGTGLKQITHLPPTTRERVDKRRSWDKRRPLGDGGKPA